MTSETKAMLQKRAKPQLCRGFVARFPRAIEAVARVSEFGANKHEVEMGDMSYLYTPGAEVLYLEAELRHMVAEVTEGECDPESMLLHKAHKAWDAMADLEKAIQILSAEAKAREYEETIT